MELKEGECRIYYKIKERFLPFEQELKELFENNGYHCWASGFSCDGERDLAFDRINPV